MLTIAYYLLLELQNCERDRKGAKRGRVFIYYKKGLGEGGGRLRNIADRMKRDC